jgi:ABC-type Fe3+/spermidine/putrescine transport system ATPase subunit
MTKDLGLTAIHVTHDQAEAMAISDRIAVMKKGGIKQVGTPSELYMSPKNIFVANFIGESNFLEGYVAKETVNETEVDLRGDIHVKVSQDRAVEGKRVVLAIRPEAFTIKKGERESARKENAISGTVERVTFEGTNIRYEVRLRNQDSIVIVKPSMSEEWLNNGEQVTVQFPSDKVHVFEHPDAGLKEEIAVE